MTRDIKRQIAKRDRLFDRNERFPSIANEQEYDNICSQIKANVKNAKASYLKDHLTKQLEEGNSKPLYNYLSKNSGRSNSITGLKDTPTEEIPDKLADHFASVYCAQQHSLPKLQENEYSDMNKINVSKSGIQAMLK